MSDKELYDYYRLCSGRKRLTVQEKELILDDLITQCAVDEKRSSRWAFFRSPIFIGIISTAALLMIATPIYIVFFERNEQGRQFSEKGGNDNPFVALQCLAGGQVKPCAAGQILTFKIRPPQNKLYFSAFAKNRSSGKVVWYYPAEETGKSAQLKGDGIRVLGEGMVIGNEHSAGTYDVFCLFSPSPLKRDAIRNAFEDRIAKESSTVMLKVPLVVH